MKPASVHYRKSTHLLTVQRRKLWNKNNFYLLFIALPSRRQTDFERGVRKCKGIYDQARLYEPRDYQVGASMGVQSDFV